MERYQQADPKAPHVLVVALSPALLRFFRSQVASRQQADDLLQETRMRIHRVRHTYWPSEPVLPWVYAIERHVRIDGYRRTRRIAMHEVAIEALPERPVEVEHRDAPPAFDELVAALPDSQREAVTMLKVGGLSLAEVARATSSTVGAIKQMAHRAYRRLRELLETSAEDAVAALGYQLERCSRLVEAPYEEILRTRTESDLSSGVTGLRVAANDQLKGYGN